MTDLASLIFDVDGTLAENEEGHRAAFNRVFAEWGLGWHWDRAIYDRLLSVTGGRERLHHYIEHYRPSFHPTLPRDQFIGALHARKTEHYVALLAQGGIPLRPGVARLIRESRAQGLRLAIATTTSLSNVIALLEIALGGQARDWFEVIAAGDAVAQKKPAPDIYVNALERLDIDPARCLAIEDSANGLQSALGAGVQTLITTSEYTRNENFSGASLVVDQLGEPDMPFRVRAGDANGFRYVSVDLLRWLHAHR